MTQIDDHLPGVRAAIQKAHDRFLDEYDPTWTKYRMGLWADELAQAIRPLIVLKGAGFERRFANRIVAGWLAEAVFYSVTREFLEEVGPDAKKRGIVEETG